VTSGQLIRAARLKAGLTQLELAERLNRDRAQIARWETEGQEPSFSNLCAVIEACGYTLRVEIVEPELDPALDAEIAQALQLAPQQRLQALLDQHESSG
jgi:transcriptional regulator with XRE-family HTH domain